MAGRPTIAFVQKVRSMAELLYLDTARLGQMSPTAASMYADFGRLAAEVPTCPCTEDFLFHGADASPGIIEQYSELHRWPGIKGLKHQLKSAFARNAADETQVLLANRTTDLMESGVRSVLNHCRRVLLTDLTWPPYLHWMLEQFGRSGIDVSFLPLKHAIWKEIRTADEIAEMILIQLRADNCDGLFLPAVTHTGIKLPVAAILNELNHQPASTVSVIDASQAFGHIDTNSWAHLADFTFGGMHKWVRSYLPLAVGFVQNPQMRIICNQSSGFEPGQRTGTINLAPFLTTCGALADLTAALPLPRPSCRRRIHNKLSRVASWYRCRTHSSLRSRIRLLRTQQPPTGVFTPAELRRHLAEHGIVATVYHDRSVRISI